MGQGHSELTQEQRFAKARQSTRSLPDNRGKRRSKDVSSSRRYLGTNGSEVVSGVYVGSGNKSQSTDQFWLKDAAPYYCPAPANHRTGPRSLDLSYSKPWSGSMHEYQYAMLQDQQRYESNKADAWSDVASDMYRIRDSQSRQSGNHSTSKRHKSKRRYQSHQQPPPPVPPKIFQEPRPTSLDIKKADSSFIRLETPVTPPKSPGSAECDKLVISSLRAELLEERSLRFKSEKKQHELEKNLDGLVSQLAGMQQRKSSPELTQGSGKIKELEDQLIKAEQQLVSAEDENRRIKDEQKQQQAAYDKCLDDIANKVAKALMQQKTLKTECVKQQKRILEVEWENKLLKAQLKLSGGSPYINRNQAYEHNENSVNVRKKNSNVNQEKMQKLRQSMGSDPTMDLSTVLSSQEMVSSDSLVSVTSHQFAMLPEGDRSLMTNGGEGLCSRRQSFIQDISNMASLPRQQPNMAAPKLWTFVPPKSAVVMPLHNSAPLHRGPNPPPAPVPPVSNAQKFGGLIEKTSCKQSDDDLYSQDEVCNFAQRLGDTESNTSGSTNNADIELAKSNGHTRVLDFSAVSDVPSIERMRGGGDSGSSLGSVAFLHALLHTSLQKPDDTQTSTPRASPLRSGPKSSDGTLTPTPIDGRSEADLPQVNSIPLIPQEAIVAHASISNAMPSLPLRHGKNSKTILGNFVTSPSSFDDGYSTLSSDRQVDNGQYGTVIKSASFDVTPSCAKEQLSQAIEVEGISTESLEWDQLLVQTLLMTASDHSNGKGDEKTASSSGFSSGADHSNDLETVWRVRGGRCFSSEDVFLRNVTSPMTDSLPSLDAAWSSNMSSPCRDVLSMLCAVNPAETALRRVKSDSKLSSSFGRRSRVDRLLGLVLSRRVRRNWGNHTPTAEKSMSSCDLTQYERNMLQMHKESLPSEENLFCEIDGSREGLFELTEGDKAAICSNEKSSDDTDEEIKSEERCHFNSSFYAICHMASPGTCQPSITNEQQVTEVDKHKVSPETSEESDFALTPNERTAVLDQIYGRASTSFTSEDSEDDGQTTVQAWVKQLRTKKTKKCAAGRSVVRYSPPRTSILSRDVFSRFGARERKALATFDFLKDQSTDISGTSSPDGVKLTNSSKKAPKAKRKSRTKLPIQPESSPDDVVEIKLRQRKPTSDKKNRLSRSLSDLTAYYGGAPVGEKVESVYENLPYHSRVKREYSNERYATKSSGSVNSLRSGDSNDSSLFLSDLCGASANTSLSSSSSISFQY